MNIRNGKDFYAGFFFLLVGAAVAYAAHSYSLGTARDMGPGYFPSLIGYLLLLIGGITVARGLLLRGEGLKVHSLRPLLMVSCATLAFALLLKPCGLLVALLALVLLSCLGSREFRTRDAAILYVTVAALATLLFVYLLGLPLPLYWGE